MVPIFWEENFFSPLVSPNEVFFCAKNIFSSHLATMATGSANPGLINKLITPFSDGYHEVTATVAYFHSSVNI